MAKALTTRWWHAWATVMMAGSLAVGSGCARMPMLPAAGNLSAGTAAQAASLGAVHKVHMDVPHRFQGDTASCGPSSLWTTMSYHLGPGKVNFNNLDKSLRPTGNLTNYIGTMPGALVKAAERYHFTATVTNEATTRQLRSMLDNGLPVIIMGEWTDGKESDLHFVTVNGYEGLTNDDTTWIISDSLVEDGSELRWSTQQLMAFWDDVQLYGRTLPYQKVMVNIAPAAKADALPEDNRTLWLKFLDSVMKTGNDVLRWLDNGRNGEAPIGWNAPAGLQ